MKRRWEICTAIFFAAVLIVIIFQRNNSDELTRFCFQVGDVAISLVLMTIVGRKCKKAHHYSVFVIIFIRAVWTMLQVQLKLNGVEPFASYYDFYSHSSQLIFRVVTPAGMLFLTEWKLYLYLIFPFSIIMQIFLTLHTEELYGSSCEALLENFNLKSTIVRDITQFVYISMAIYSHVSTLANRFINNEKSQL